MFAPLLHQPGMNANANTQYFCVQCAVLYPQHNNIITSPLAGSCWRGPSTTRWTWWTCWCAGAATACRARPSSAPSPTRRTRTTSKKYFLQCFELFFACGKYCLNCISYKLCLVVQPQHGCLCHFTSAVQCISTVRFPIWFKGHRTFICIQIPGKYENIIASLSIFHCHNKYSILWSKMSWKIPIFWQNLKNSIKELPTHWSCCQ